MEFLKKHWLSVLLILLLETQLIYLAVDTYHNSAENLLAYVIFKTVMITILFITVLYRNNQINQLKEKLNEYNSRI